MRHRVQDIERKISETSQLIDDLYQNEAEKDTPFGGRLILADLAGVDSDHQPIVDNSHSRQQTKDSTSINKSLIGPEGCISALSSSKPVVAVPFRNSSLTRLLEEVLTPRVKRDSKSTIG